jgi:hypothetical protein
LHISIEQTSSKSSEMGVWMEGVAIAIAGNVSVSRAGKPTVGEVDQIESLGAG